MKKIRWYQFILIYIVGWAFHLAYFNENLIFSPQKVDFDASIFLQKNDF